MSNIVSYPLINNRKNIWRTLLFNMIKLKINYPWFKKKYSNLRSIKGEQLCILTVQNINRISRIKYWSFSFQCWTWILNKFQIKKWLKGLLTSSSSSLTCCNLFWMVDEASLLPTVFKLFCKFSTWKEKRHKKLEMRTRSEFFFLFFFHRVFKSTKWDTSEQFGDSRTTDGLDRRVHADAVTIRGQVQQN